MISKAYGRFPSAVAYTARRMTGRDWGELAAEAERDATYLYSRGIHALDPVLAEQDSYFRKHGALPVGEIGSGEWASGTDLAAHWARDKRMIRGADVLIDMSPEEKSEGIAHEIGYARYHLWKPIVRVYPPGSVPSYSIAVLEDDVIVGSIQRAADEVLERWGSLGKRLRWRAAMYARCWPRALWHKIGAWK